MIITFKDFLTEAVSPEEIQERCAIFIKRSDGLPLYRGYGSSIMNFFNQAREVTVRKDRRPRDSTQYVHGLMDAYFQKKFGVKVRSEGLFATGDPDNAEKYGKLHYVLPVGDFKFIWGTHHGDAISDTLGSARKIENLMWVRYESEGEAVAKRVMDEIDWRDDDLPAAIRSGAEIALLVDKVIVVPVSDKKSYREIIGK